MDSDPMTAVTETQPHHLKACTDATTEVAPEAGPLNSHPKKTRT